MRATFGNDALHALVMPLARHRHVLEARPRAFSASATALMP